MILYYKISVLCKFLHFQHIKTFFLYRTIWLIVFGFGCYYGYLLYTPILDKWYNKPVHHDVEKTDFYVKNIPFPAVTICSNNKIVNRQLESVLLTQPWKGYSKKMVNFAEDFKSALTALVIGEENPAMLSHLSKGAIDILNNHTDSLPEVMKKVKPKAACFFTEIMIAIYPTR